MTFPTAEQEKQMLLDIDHLEAAIADPESPMYASNCVPWTADVCCHVKALLAENKKEGMYQQSDMERARAQAFSSAADTICNQWNCLPRNDAWCKMATEFQHIWKNLKNISDAYHKMADEQSEKETSDRRRLQQETGFSDAANGETGNGGE